MQPMSQPMASASPPNEPSAVTAMVLGILGLAVCGVLAPVAWVMGKNSVANIKTNPGSFSGEGMAQAGYIMGIIGTCLLILAAIFMIVYFVFIAAVVGSL